jgi:hypothetical protein
MSPSPNDIRRYALGLVESYGSHSLDYADEMIQAYLANGNTGALDVWRQVKHHLLDLDRPAPPFGDAADRAAEAGLRQPVFAE